MITLFLSLHVAPFRVDTARETVRSQKIRDGGAQPSKSECSAAALQRLGKALWEAPRKRPRLGRAPGCHGPHGAAHGLRTVGFQRTTGPVASRLAEGITSALRSCGARDEVLPEVLWRCKPRWVKL